MSKNMKYDGIKQNIVSSAIDKEIRKEPYKDLRKAFKN